MAILALSHQLERKESDMHRDIMNSNLGTSADDPFIDALLLL